MPAPSKSTKRLFLASACLLLIPACAFWIWRTQFAAPNFSVALHQSIGRVLAEETAQALDETGKLVVITVDLPELPELKVQLQAFQHALQRFPRISVEKTYQVDTEGKPKYAFGSGLSGRRYVRVVNKHLEADAVVSFIGAPTLSDEEAAELQKKPVLIAESRSAAKLKRPFDQKVLHTAIVSRFQFPTPVKGKPRNPEEWFDQRFQVVTTAQIAELPTGKGD